jgi:ATP-dependent Clp protease ATP-binding subunit ClpA
LELIKPASPSDGGRLPFTPRAKAVLGGSVDEALQLGHSYIGTEHLLLGLFADEDSIAAKVLLKLGVSHSMARDRTLEVLAGYGKN